MNFTEYVLVMQDLTGVSKISCSSTAPSLENAVSEVVCANTLYMTIPQSTIRRLQTDLPHMNKQREKLEAEIERLKNRMHSKTYQDKSINAKETDCAKVC